MQNCQKEKVLLGGMGREIKYRAKNAFTTGADKVFRENLNRLWLQQFSTRESFDSTKQHLNSQFITNH